MQISDANPLQRPGLIQRLIAGCTHNPFLTMLTAAAVAAWGYYALRHVPLDAIPDLSDAQVIVFTEWPGRSPDLVEDQITYPVSSALVAAPNVKRVRGQSFLGLSFVYVIFKDGTDIYWARSRVREYLNEVTGRLPDNVHPTLGPDATGVGWVFEYALVDRSGRYDLAQLRSLQDWNIRYALESVEGVAEVASVGGFIKQYQIQLDPDKVLAFTKTYSMGFAAVLAVTLVPALAVLIIRGKIRGETWNPLNRLLVAGYAPVVRFVVRHRYFSCLHGEYFVAVWGRNVVI